MFGDTEKARLPENWQVIPFSDLACINPPRRLERGEKYPYIPMEALDTGFSKHANGFCRVWKGSGGAKFQNGDVLLARITPSAENGKTAIVDVGDKGKGFGSTELIVMVPKTEASTSRFIYYLLKYDVVRQQAIGQMTGSTGRQRIPADAFEIIQVLAPPLEQQRKIAAILESVDNAIEKTQAVIDQLKTVKRGLMQQLFTSGVPGWHSELEEVSQLGKVPKAWSVESLGKFITETQNGLYKPQSDYGKGTFIVRIDNFSDGDVLSLQDFRRVAVTSEEVKGFCLEEEDIVINRVNSLSYLGKTAIVGPLNENVVFESNMMRLRLETDSLDPQFAARLLSQRFVRSRLLQTAKLAIAQASINQQDIHSLLIAVPNIEEQKAIVKITNSIEDRLEIEQAKKSQLIQLKKGLMQGLLSGRMAVTV